MRALVAGSAGQLGRELVARLGGEVAWKGDRAELDVTDGAAVAGLVARVRPDVVFNATAFNRVDAAEAEPLGAFAVNAVGAHWLARAARDAGALLVHVSTDYVFDGTASRPYREEDPPRPLGAYGASKLAGEHLVAAAGGEHLVVRTSGVLGRGGSEQKGGSFVDRIVAQARAGRPLRVVADQVFAPTCASDLARVARRARARGGTGARPRDERRLVQLARARGGRPGGGRARCPGRAHPGGRPLPARPPARLLRARHLPRPPPWGSRRCATGETRSPTACPDRSSAI